MINNPQLLGEMKTSTDMWIKASKKETYKKALYYKPLNRSINYEEFRNLSGISDNIK
jgi:hypothetical protein